MPLINRTYHPYWEWEEVEANMWGSVKDKQSAIYNAAGFMSNTERFVESMEKVIGAWTKSCEHNLSNLQSNRKAWLGWAAVAYELNLPAEITRLAWGMLTDDKRDLANQGAEEVIRMWENAKN